MIKSIIKFGAPWCSGCVAVDTALDQLQAIKKDVKVTKVDIEEDEELSIKFKVRGLPTLIFLDENNNEVSRHAGAMTIQNLIEMFN